MERSSVVVKKFCLLPLLLCLLLPQAVMSQSYDVYRSWFTDATSTEFSNYGYTSTTITKPGSAPNPVPGGTRGNCFDMTNLAYDGYNAVVGAMSEANYQGEISFWIRPTEAGKIAYGGAEHILLRAGAPDSDGMQVSWDNSKGILRFKMTGLNGAAAKTTVCRADISSWAANDWHHVQVAWYAYDGAVPDGKVGALGLGLWIDKVAVASCVFGGTSFMSNPAGNYVKVGANGTNGSKCYIDELVFRPWPNGTEFAYRHFFVTAPYTAIEVTHMPFGDSDPWSAGTTPGPVLSVPSDNCILCSRQKQFGVIGTRLLNTSSNVKIKEYITNYDKRFSYGTWACFDAKPNISWSISGGATHNGDGLFTGGSYQASPTITVNFREFTNVTYGTEVRRWSGYGYTKPDLGIQWVERTPRYDKNGVQKWPNPGDTVTTRVYYGNFGSARLTTNFYIKFEKAVDANNNFRVDAGESWSTIAENYVTTNINAGTHDLSSSCTWTWPSTNPLTTGSVFIRVTLDSRNNLSNEISESNNMRCEKNNARAYHWGYRQEHFNSFFSNKTVNLVGTFSGYDWYNAQVDRVNTMVRSTKCDTIPSVGIQDALRVDHFIAWDGDDPAPWYDEDYLYESGFPEMWIDDEVGPMDVDSMMAHEQGHTALALPDLYGSVMSVYNVLLGTAYGGSVLFPIVANIGTDESESEKIGMFSAHVFDYPDEMADGYSPLMDSTCWWLDSFCAGKIHYQRQTRGGIWDVSLRDMAPRGSGSTSKNKIKLYAIDDTPLVNARVWLYQGSNAGNWLVTINKYYPNWPKFAGATDANGIFTIPTTTATSWDDWTTDTVEKNTPTYGYTMPFDTLDGGPGMMDWLWADLMLVKITGKDPRNTNNNMEEFHILPCTELANAFFKNVVNGGSSSTEGVYEIRTHLAAVNGPGAQNPTAQTLTTNYPPYLNMTVTGADSVIYGDVIEVYTRTGMPITFNSGAVDPEGQTKYYWWVTPIGSFFGGSSYNTTFYDTGEYWFGHFVIDGIRSSEVKELVVFVQ